MPFDGIVAAAISHELKDKITGARVEKIHQPSRDMVILALHRAEGKFRLLLSASAEGARVHLTRESFENPQNPPTFCMVLRKHLEGGRVTGVSQEGLERVIIIEIESPDDYGKLTVKELITEVMGRHSNVILVDRASGVILDGIKRYSHTVSRWREVFPGRAYIPPPTQAKADPLATKEEEWVRLILEGPPLPAAKLLVSLFHGLSPLMAEELLSRAGLDPKAHTEDWGHYEYSKLWQAWDELFAAVKRGEFNSTLAENALGDPVAFAGTDLTLYDGMSRLHLSMSEVLDRYYLKKAIRNAFQEKNRHLSGIVEHGRDNLLKKIALQDDALAQAGEGETWRRWGDLLMANLYCLTERSDNAVLQDIFEEGAPEITIDLNPMLTPSQNAQRYYKKYNRARNTREKASKIKEGLLEELAYLDSVAAALKIAASREELLEIEDELAASGYIKKSAGKGGKQKPPEPRPARFVSSDGYEILVGRNNRQNDWLTMRLTRPDDLWLHVKDAPGSHVAIRDPGAEIPDDALEEAAVLAAYYSGVRASGKVAVDYTWRRNVWKPKGARPGFVLYENQWTIMVNLNPDKIKIEQDDPA